MMRVEIKPSDPARVRRLKERFSLSLLAATVLERRGVDSDEEMMFTLESDAVYLHSPRRMSPRGCPGAMSHMDSRWPR